MISKVLINIINNNIKLKNYKKTEKKNIHSISFLINKKMTQSDCIKFGIIIEDVLRDLLSQKFRDIREHKCKKNLRETDHLFMDIDKKVIYCAELKSNLYLDTEKTISTVEKMYHLHTKLQIQYPNFEIKTSLVCLRYYDESIIPKNIKKKYSIPILSVNSYLQLLGCDVIFKTEEEYSIFINYIANKMV